MTGILAAARRELEEICRLLARPTSPVLEDCAVRLAAIAAAIEAGRAQSPQLPASQPTAVEAHLLRRTLSNAQRLLDKAAQFHRGWQRLRGVLTGGYRADGSVAEVASPRRIFVQG